MFQPVKAAFGQWMEAFYDAIVPTTESMKPFVLRGFPTSCVWAPTRMIDSAEEMLIAWMKNDTLDKPTTPAPLPVLIVAMSKDYVPSMRDFTTQIADPIEVIIPTDDKERVFKLRTIAGDIRTQVCIFAHDEPTAKSIASQFLLFLDATPNRRFRAYFEFAGQTIDFPVQIEDNAPPAMNIATDAKNITILAIDITLKAMIPLFDAPKAGDPDYQEREDGEVAGYKTAEEIAIDARIESGKISGGQSQVEIKK